VIKKANLYFFTMQQQQFQQFQQQSAPIHCKIQNGDEYRRFLLTSSQYTVLLKQIKTIFNYDADQVLVIRYKDDEGDLVTLSSDEELLFALEIFSGSVLRLSIHTEQQRERCGRPHGGERGPYHHWERGCSRWGEKHGAHWAEKKCGKMGQKWMEKCLENPEFLVQKKLALQGKLDMMKHRKQCVEAKAQEHPDAPGFQYRLATITQKIQRMEAFLARINDITPNTFATPVVVSEMPTPEVFSIVGPTDDWREQKASLWALKVELRNARREGAPEERIKDLKAQIHVIKETLWEKRSARKNREGKCSRRGRHN
jgi:hypothetical protein